VVARLIDALTEAGIAGRAGGVGAFYITVSANSSVD